VYYWQTDARDAAEIFWLTRSQGSLFMKERGLTIPEIMLVGGTRVAVGVGLGLLIADCSIREE
jgi:hypothetical protein